MMKTAARKQRAAIFVPRRVIKGKNNNIVLPLLECIYMCAHNGQMTAIYA